jgi:hypothetical protein
MSTYDQGVNKNYSAFDRLEFDILDSSTILYHLK